MKLSIRMEPVRFGDVRLPRHFWSKVRLAECGCWEWIAAKTRGYGQFWASSTKTGDHRHVIAHRYSYSKLVGPIPEGMQIDHFRCSNPSCVNPEHLRPVTPRENQMRGDTVSSLNAAKDRCACGRDYDRISRSGGRNCSVCMKRRTRESMQRYRDALVLEGGPRLEEYRRKLAEAQRKSKAKKLFRLVAS